MLADVVQINTLHLTV